MHILTSTLKLESKQYTEKLDIRLNCHLCENKSRVHCHLSDNRVGFLCHLSGYYSRFHYHMHGHYSGFHCHRLHYPICVDTIVVSLSHAWTLHKSNNINDFTLATNFSLSIWSQTFLLPISTKL